MFKRSVRNVTVSSRLWINYALAKEMSNHSDSEIKRSTPFLFLFITHKSLLELIVFIFFGFWILEVYNEAMSSGLETSDDYLKMWHSYLDYLRRSMIANLDGETASRKEEIMEAIRDTFEKAIVQLYECNFLLVWCAWFLAISFYSSLLYKTTTSI